MDNKEEEYSFELTKLIGENASKRVMAQLENDPLKRHVILEIVERLDAGEDVYDELVKVFVRLAKNSLIDEWVEQDNKKE
jgi:hypothetical protein